MLHELGHFLAAKRGGMKVTEYFVGLRAPAVVVPPGRDRVRDQGPPPRRLREDPGHDQPRGGRSGRRGAAPTASKPFHARLLVAVAGSAMHFLMAFVLLWVLLAFVGVPNSNQVQIQGLSAGRRHGPARPPRPAIRPGDVVVSVDGKPVGGQRDDPHLGHPGPSRTSR